MKGLFSRLKPDQKKHYWVVLFSLVRLVSQAHNMEENFPNMFFFSDGIIMYELFKDLNHEVTIFLL